MVRYCTLVVVVVVVLLLLLLFRREAGRMTDPFVCVPMATGTSPEATAAAEGAFADADGGGVHLLKDRVRL